MKKILVSTAAVLSGLCIFLFIPGDLPAFAAPTPAPASSKTVEEQLYEYYTVLAAQEYAKGNTKAAQDAQKKAEEYAAIVNAQKNGNYTGSLATPKKSVLDTPTTYYDMGNGWASSMDGMSFRHSKTGEIYLSYKGLTTDYPEFGKFVYSKDTCKVMVVGCCERLSRYGILTYEKACEKMKAEGYSLRSADKKALVQWVDPNVTQVKFTHNAMVCVFERDYTLVPYATPAEYYNSSWTGATPTPTPTPYYYYDPSSQSYVYATATPSATPTVTPTSTPYTVTDAERYRVN